MKKLAHTLGCLVLLALPAVSHACTVCMGEAEAPMTRGMVAGIGILLAVTFCVLAVFGAFVVYLARREAKMNRSKDMLKAV